MKYAKGCEESTIIIITLRWSRRNVIRITQPIPRKSLVGNNFAVEESPRN